jgi:hypothetical protein
MLTNREGQGILIDIGMAIAGFALSIFWGRSTNTRMTQGTFRTLAIVWIGLALFGMAMIPVMRHVK